MLTLVINPGSTSTKLAVYQELQELSVKTYDHSAGAVKEFSTIQAQADYRFACVLEFLQSSAIDPAELSIIMARGGLLHPLPGGVYRVNAAMLQDLESARYGEHASNLGAVLADRMARISGCEAFIADPVVVDELTPEARISGMPDIERKSIFHALNQKIAARESAAKLGKSYEDCNLIVAHLEGGISIGAHAGGKVVDVNNALDGEGPFTPERSGGLPAGDLVRLVRSGIYSEEELKRRITGNGGLYAYWGSKDMRKLETAVDQGDETALFYLKAMVYQISKEIGALGAVLKGKVDAVVLTGGMAWYEYMVELITERIAYLGPVLVIPGEREMLSLAENARGILKEGREIQEYVRA